MNTVPSLRPQLRELETCLKDISPKTTPQAIEKALNILQHMPTLDDSIGMCLRSLESKLKRLQSRVKNKAEVGTWEFLAIKFKFEILWSKFFPMLTTSNLELETACKKSDIEKLEKLVKETAINPFFCRINGKDFAWEFACEQKDLKLIQFLLKISCVSDPNQSIAALIELMSEKEFTTELLNQAIEEGLNVNIVFEHLDDNISLINVVLACNRSDLMETLVFRGASDEFSNRDLISKELVEKYESAIARRNAVLAEMASQFHTEINVLSFTFPPSLITFINGFLPFTVESLTDDELDQLYFQRSTLKH